MWKTLLLLTVQLAGLTRCLDDLYDGVDCSLGDCGPDLETDRALLARRQDTLPRSTQREGVQPARVPPNFAMVTTASEDLDGYRRLARSAQVYDVPLTTLGLGQPWLSGGSSYKGGHHKIKLLKAYMEPFKNDTEKIIMFTDSYDVIVLSGVNSIVAAFERFDCRVVISAEVTCWPDPSLASKYPAVQKGDRFLNSGGCIGYASELFKVLSSLEVTNTSGDQLFFTKLYLNEKFRVEYGIKLDHESQIFKNLYLSHENVELRFNEVGDPYLHNKPTGTDPLVVHGNGDTKIFLNTLGNYVARSWSSQTGCVTCLDHVVDLQGKNAEHYPTVLLAVFIERPTPFLEEFFEKLENLNYPKEKLHLFVHSAMRFHTRVVESFLQNHKHRYLSVRTIGQDVFSMEGGSQISAMNYCNEVKCDHYFYINSEAHLDNRDTLKLLVEQNRNIIAPMLVRRNKLWSNFWGAITDKGFYNRSMDYLHLIHNVRRGVWNVPCIMSCYLIKAQVMNRLELRSLHFYPDAAFCRYVVHKGTFMYVTNRFDFGHLVDTDHFDQSKTNPEMYETIANRLDWEKRYIHSDYREHLSSKASVNQPCPNVFTFPIVTERFCRELVEIVETFQEYNKVQRFDGHPKKSSSPVIYMNQLALESQWTELLNLYVVPLQELISTMHLNNPQTLDPTWTNEVDPSPGQQLRHPRLNYVELQSPQLRAHSRVASPGLTFTLALNTPDEDFQGCGRSFVQLNCSVTSTPPGWLLIHPGNLGTQTLPVTSGTRYTLVSTGAPVTAQDTLVSTGDPSTQGAEQCPLNPRYQRY